MMFLTTITVMTSLTTTTHAQEMSHALNDNYIVVPSMYVSILQQLIYEWWSQILLYISAYESNLLSKSSVHEGSSI